MSTNPFDKLQPASKEIFSFIQKHGNKTKQEIIDKTHMKLTTLNRVMKPLEELKLIEEMGTKESTGGRKPSVYGIDSHSYFVLGIDISRTYVEIIISTLGINIVNKEYFELDDSFTPEKTVSYIGKLVSGMLRKYNINENQVLGAGVGTVGPMDKLKGILINPVNFPTSGWVNMNIKALLENELKIPVIIENGANAALFAEKYFGIGKDVNGILYFNCGVGIRTAAAVSDTIIRTHLNKEDVFAHMIVDMNGEECSCGYRGCIECYSTIIAIVNKFKDEVRKGRDTIIKKAGEDIGYKNICMAAEKGDALSREIIKKAAEVFGVGLLNYINILNPQMVILSGPLIQNSDYFYKLCVDTAISKNSGYKFYFSSDNHKNINKNSVIFYKQGMFKQDAISIGAAALYIEEMVR